MLGVPLVPAQFALSASTINAGISQAQPLHQLAHLPSGMCGQRLAGCPQQAAPQAPQVPPGQPFFQGLPLVPGATAAPPSLVQDVKDGVPQQMGGLPQHSPEQNQAQIQMQQMQLHQFQQQQQMFLQLQQQQQQQQQALPMQLQPPSQSEHQPEEGKPGTSGTTQQQQQYQPLTAEPLPSGGTLPEAAASTSMLLQLGNTGEGFIPAVGNAQLAQEQPSSSLSLFGCPMPLSAAVGSAAPVIGSQTSVLTSSKGCQASNLQATVSTDLASIAGTPQTAASNGAMPPSMNMLASIAGTPQIAADGVARKDAEKNLNSEVPSMALLRPQEAKKPGTGEPSTLMQAGSPGNCISALSSPVAGVPGNACSLGASALPGLGRMQSTETLTPLVAQPAVGLPAVAVPAFKIGDAVEAQCAGWGAEWFPGKVRELLPNGEVQVLWEGDEPSISNLPPSAVRLRKQQQQQADTAEESTVACSASTPAPQSAPTTLPGQQQGDLPAQALASKEAQNVTPASEAASGGQTQKRLTDEQGGSQSIEMKLGTAQPIAQTLPAARDGVAASPRSYRYELGPGDDVAAPMANLRRRISVELRDGCSVTVQIRIVRPAGRPEADKEQPVPTGVIADAPDTSPPQPAPPLPAPEAKSDAVAGHSQPAGDVGTTDASPSTLGPWPGSALPPPWRR